MDRIRVRRVSALVGLGYVGLRLKVWVSIECSYINRSVQRCWVVAFRRSVTVQRLE